MYQLQLTLQNERVPQPGRADAEFVQGFLWTHLGAESVEHIWARAGSDGIELDLFLRGDSTSEIVVKAMRDQITSLIPKLAGWHIATPNDFELDG
jgi:hypothetical protein